MPHTSIDLNVGRRFLIFGDAAHQFPLEHRPDIPLFVVPLAATDGVPRAVDYVAAAEPATGEILALSRDGAQLYRRPLPEAITTWHGCFIGTDFRALLAQWHPPGVAAALTPLMVIHLCGNPSGRAAPVVAEVLVSTRVRAIGAVFTRVARFQVGAEDDLTTVVFGGLRLSPAFHDEVAVEWQEFTTFEKGIEIEAKIGLLDPVPIWSLTSHLSSLVGTDVLPGFIPDVGNEVQRWENTQEMCEVFAPADQVGYIAAWRQASGTYVKYKRFAHDGLRRQETVERLDDPLPGTLPEFITARHPELAFRPLPSLTRTHFDVNLESSATGHFFGIEIDEVRELSGGRILRQAEVEYHRSRVHDGLDPSTIEPELERLAGLVQRYLTGLGVANERTYYSKLSWLRDCVDGPL